VERGADFTRRTDTAVVWAQWVVEKALYVRTPAMKREEKGAVVRYTKVVGVRGVDRGLGYNMGTDKKLPKGRGIL
jgi:hypothetical protein